MDEKSLNPTPTTPPTSTPEPAPIAPVSTTPTEPAPAAEPAAPAAAPAEPVPAAPAEPATPAPAEPAAAPATEADDPAPLAPVTPVAAPEPAPAETPAPEVPTAEPAKKNKKPLIFILIGLLVVAIGAVATILIISNSGSSDGGDDKPEVKEPVLSEIDVDDNMVRTAFLPFALEDNHPFISGITQVFYTNPKTTVDNISNLDIFNLTTRMLTLTPCVMSNTPENIAARYANVRPETILPDDSNWLMMTTAAYGLGCFSGDNVNSGIASMFGDIDFAVDEDFKAHSYYSYDEENDEFYSSPFGMGGGANATFMRKLTEAYTYEGDGVKELHIYERVFRVLLGDNSITTNACYYDPSCTERILVEGTDPMDSAANTALYWNYVDQHPEDFEEFKWTFVYNQSTETYVFESVERVENEG